MASSQTEKLRTAALNAKHGVAPKEADEQREGGGIGANASKKQIEFWPGGVIGGELVSHTDSEEGEGISLEYSGLLFERMTPGYRRLTLHFVTHVVVIEGPDLKGLLGRIKSHMCGKVVVMNALQVAALIAKGKPAVEVGGISVTDREPEEKG